MRDSATDMDSYLESLRMVLTAGPFDAMNLQRITQLINKTNQFNLMTERLDEAEVTARRNDPRWITLYARLADRFGDNGLIAVLMARIDETQGSRDALVASWLMSCRVLGRGVEQACLNVLAGAARARGVSRLIGQYRPTEKNGMVAMLYPGLGFSELPGENDGITRFGLDLRSFTPRRVWMETNAPAEAMIEQ